MQEPALIPEQREGENIFEYVRRAAAELRENRHTHLADQCRRIEEKVRRHGNAQERRSTQAQERQGGAAQEHEAG